MTETNSYEKTIDKRQGGIKSELIKIFRETPIVLVACKKVGISRDTFYRWKKEDDDFLRQINEAIREGTELVNDMCQSQLIQLIKEKRLQAIIWWQKNNDPRYGEKVVLGAPAPPTFDLATPEEKELFSKGLGLLSEKNKKRKKP